MADQVVLGRSGMGHRVSVAEVIRKARAEGRQVVIIDPGAEYRALLRDVDGTYRVVEASQDAFDPLHPRQAEE